MPSSQSGSRSITARGAWSTAWTCASRPGPFMASWAQRGRQVDDDQDAAGDGPAQLRPGRAPGPRGRRLASRGAGPHRLSGGGASALRLDDRRRGRAVRPLVPCRPLEPAAARSDSRPLRDPARGRSSAGCRTASGPTSPWPWRSPPIPTCSSSTTPRWAWIRSPAAIS